MAMLEQSKFLEKLKNSDPEKDIKVETRGAYADKDSVVYKRPAAFDIETTSFATDNNGRQYTPEEYAEACEADKTAKDKMTLHAYCYIWQFGIDGIGATYGRHLEQFPAFLEKVKKIIGNGAAITIFVHNLKFEFQFIKDLFQWDKVFALEKRVPVYADTGTIRFRCSYIMTGKSLETLGNECKGPERKLAGDLDYNLARNSGTALTAKEMAYCENDITVLLQYVREQIEKEGSIGKIPMTKTGYVRRDVRENVLKSPDYARLVAGLTITPDEYLYLRDAFKGGYTHAGIYQADKILRNVDSWDITSSYPATMVCEYFPMSCGKEENLRKLTLEKFKTLLKTKCCLIRLHFDSIESSYDYEQYISRGPDMVNVIENNGRIIYAENVTLTMTEIDFFIFRKVYKFKNMKIMRMWTYERGYLPTEIVKMILHYYEQKTTLKGEKGREDEYKIYKEYVNSIYGMMVTDIVRDEVEYNAGKWIEDPVFIDNAIKRYNKNKTRFLSYPWGVWVTAHSRLHLWKMIHACGSDYVYTDTDSVKVINGASHKAAFEAYNKRICEKMEQAMRFHDMPVTAYRPRTIKSKKHPNGVEKPLGVYDFEETYKTFKTLGAKKYIVEHKNKKLGRYGKIEITVAGVGKKAGSEYFGSIKKPFENFKPGTVISWRNCGKLLSTYIDTEDETILTDYTGHAETVTSRSGLALTPIGYSLGISKAYEDLLDGMDEERRSV